MITPTRLELLVGCALVGEHAGRQAWTRLPEGGVMQGRRNVPTGAVALLALLLVVGSDAVAGAQSSQHTKLCLELNWKRSLISVQRADRLVKYRQQYDTAAELYRAVLAQDPSDRCALRGLARIRQEQKAEANDTPLKRASNAWDGLYANWVTPAVGILLPLLALLLIFLVLPRLATRLVIPTDALEWPAWLQTTSWWGGFAMLSLAASVPLVLSYLSSDLRARPVVAGFVLAAFLASMGLVWCILRCCLRRRYQVVAWLGELFLAAALGFVAATVAARDVRTQTDLPWIGLVMFELLLIAVIIGYGVLLLLRPRLTSSLQEGVGELSGTTPDVIRHMLAAVVAIIALWLAITWLPDSGRLEQGWAWRGWLLALGVALGVAGSLLVSIARGLRLRLQVDATSAEGVSDANAAHYLVARLQEFGTEPPRGLEVPQQTDVTALPEDALTTLPQGRVIAALFNIFRTVLPTVPWHATVSMTEHDTATVTLTRNGRVVKMARISRSELNLPAIPVEGGARDDAITHGYGQLLTAAAALILFALAEYHPRLQVGLCGAQRWQSSALHALAVEEPHTKDISLKKRLLAAAVDFDHGNALARVAYLHCFGRRGSDANDQQQFAKLMGDFYDEVFPRSKTRHGYEALELRMIFSRIAANLNVELLLRSSENAMDRKTAQQAWQEARDWAERLISKLTKDYPRNEQLQKFINEARPSTFYLWCSIEDRAKRSRFDDHTYATWNRDQEKIRATIAHWDPDLRQSDPATPLSSEIYYDRACWNAERRDVRGKRKRHALERAIADLREAATAETLRDWARQDPSLQVFRDPDTKYELRRGYKEIVGGVLPPSEFIDLTPFERHADKLRAIGIQTAEQLEAASAWRLSLRLGVERSLVRHWQDVAQLATATRDAAGSIDITALALLLDAGVGSPEILWRRLGTPESRKKLYAELVKAAADLAVEPDRKSTVDRWRKR